MNKVSKAQAGAQGSSLASILMRKAQNSVCWLGPGIETTLLFEEEKEVVGAKQIELVLFILAPDSNHGTSLSVR